MTSSLIRPAITVKSLIYESCVTGGQALPEVWRKLLGLFSKFNRRPCEEAGCLPACLGFLLHFLSLQTSYLYVDLKCLCSIC